jgi:hypothetical protein
VLLELFQDDPDVEYGAADAEAAIRKRGWVTESNEPVNAVRTALARLKNSNDLETTGRGRFRLAAQQPAPADDPWGSSAANSGGMDDESPF